MAKVFSIANQKGGVGKTTTTVNLGAGLARLGIPTLIIDLDAQANATSALGIEKTEGKSLYKVLHGEAAAADMIVATSTKKLDLIPSEVDLAAVESELAQAENYLGRLREALAPVIASGKYKAVLVDCREPSEWADTGVATPATLLPKSDFDGDKKLWKEFLAKHQGKQVILYCRSGGRSGAVAAALNEQGVKASNVGGFKDWTAAGLPTRKADEKK